MSQILAYRDTSNREEQEFSLPQAKRIFNMFRILGVVRPMLDLSKAVGITSGALMTGMRLNIMRNMSRSNKRILSQMLANEKGKWIEPSECLPYYNNTQVRAFHSSSIKYDPKKDPSAREKFQITKSKLLAQASGPLSRMLIHIKWPLKRNNKPFSIDDVSALFSWLVMGNVLWIVLGTTTFGLVLLYSLHTFDSVITKTYAYLGWSDDDQSSDAATGSGKGPKKSNKDNSIVGYITSSILSYGLGIDIELQKKSVLPEFDDGKLIFKNINIVSVNSDDTESQVSFKCNVRSLKVSLSFGKWSDGKGLINDLEFSGLRGQIYKTASPVNAIASEAWPVVFRRYHDSIHFQYDMNDQADVVPQPKPISRVDSDYEINLIKIHDSDFEILDSNMEKPMKVSIFNCELSKATGKTLLIDFFNANNVTGSINDSMFTIHKKQDYNSSSSDDDTIRFKLDGIDMGMLSRMNPRLKFNWILNGKAEIIADIRFPKADLTEDSSFRSEYKKISQLFGETLNDIGKITNSNIDIYDDTNNKDEATLMKGALQAIYQTFNMKDSDQTSLETVESLNEYVMINATIKFHNLKATVPKELPMASSSNVPFLTLHDLRSLIAYINKLDTENKPPIVVRSMVIEKLSDLYNLENLAQTKVFDVIVSDVYEEFLKMVKLDEKRIIDQKSSLWSHSLASQLLLLSLGVIV